MIPDGESIETIGIPGVLAVYNWQKGSDRYRRVERFIDYYFDHFDRLIQPSFHPKWKEINLAATVPGWTRYSIAEQKVSAITAGSPGALQSDARNLPGRGGAADRRLYQEFLNWKLEHEGRR